MSKEPEFVVSEWRECRKGDSLRGFLTLTLPSGMTLHDCSYHRREDGASWIGMPARQYTKQDGTTAWFRLVDFSDKDGHARFQKLAREAIDRYLAQNDRETAPLPRKAAR